MKGKGFRRIITTSAISLIILGSFFALSGNNAKALEGGGDYDDPEEYETVLYGDLNLDGEVDNKDLLLIRRYIADPESVTITEQGIKNADVFRDGTINNPDLLALRRYISDKTKPEYQLPKN